MSLLAEIETYYDTVPRAAATTEEVGPLTLFLADEGMGWQFYARPRLGLDGDISPDDVRKVLGRQRELGRPRAIEWVDDVTPSLLPAVRAAVPVTPVAECPLLVLKATQEPIRVEAGGRYEVLTADHPDLPVVLGAQHAAFGDTDEITPDDPGNRPALIEDGRLIVVGAYDADGNVIGGGTAAPRGTTSELMGIAVVRSARRQGHGSAIAHALVEAVRAAGVESVFLSAGSDDAASIYSAVGFERIGTACILEVSDV